MRESANKQFVIHFLFLVAFALLAMLSSFVYGITSGNDIIFHYQTALAIKDSISAGQIYPSLMANLNHGFGDVAIRFYPPLSYYTLNFFHFFTREWYFASQIQFFLIFLCGGLGTYLWSKEEFSAQQSLIAAAIYTFAPHHLNQIYNNFLFAEFSSTAIIPFCFLYVTRICRKKNKLDVLFLAIAYAFLILTHLPLTIIGSIVLGIYALFMLPKDNFLSGVFKLSGAVVSALILTAFYWSRMVSELDWVQHSTPKYFSDTWGYQNNFLFRIEGILNFQDDVLNLWLADLMLLAIFLLAIPSFILLIKNKFAVSKFVRALFAILIFSIFMTLPLSNFVWTTLPFLQKVQFPWRWLAIVSLFGAIFSSIGIVRLSETLKNSRHILLPIGVGAIFFIFIFTSAFIIKGAVYHPSQEFNSQVGAMANGESFECWWTVWAQKSAFDQKDKVSAGERPVIIRNWLATERNFSVGAGESREITLAAFYYPHWKATVNGQFVPITPTSSGTISFSIPAEAANIRLFFEEPFLVRTASALSIIGWVVITVLLTIGFARRRQNQPTDKISDTSGNLVE